MDSTVQIDKLKIGFLGLGWIGKNRMDALQNSESIEIAAISNVNSKLYAKGQLLQNADQQVEDYAVVDIMRAEGTSIHLSCSWNLPAGKDAIIEATFYETKGGASFKNVNGSFYDFTAERYVGTSSTVLATPPDQWSGRAISKWGKKLCISEQFNPESYDYVKVAALIDQIYKRNF